MSGVTMDPSVSQRLEQFRQARADKIDCIARIATPVMQAGATLCITAGAKCAGDVIKVQLVAACPAAAPCIGPAVDISCLIVGDRVQKAVKPAVASCVAKTARAAKDCIT